MEYTRIEKLIHDFKQGDESAFDKLYSSLYSGQYYYAMKIVNDSYTAEDIVQESFYKVYKSINQLDNPRAAISWISKTTHRCCIDHIRKQRQEEISIDDIDSNYGDNQVQSNFVSNPEDEAVMKVHRDDIKRSLDKLPLKMKSAVLLKYYMGLKDREIADIMDIPEGSVKSMLAGARKKLSLTLYKLYSIAPFTFISIYFMKDSGLAALLPGMLYTGSTLRRVAVTSAVVAGLSAGTMGAVRNARPLITNIDFNSVGAVQSQEIAVDVSSLDDISKVYIKESGLELEGSDGLYKGNIDNNGTYNIVAVAKNGKTDMVEINVNNIDKTGPEIDVKPFDEKSAIITLTDASGIDYSKSTGGFDEDKGVYICSYSDLPKEILATDMAGNWTSLDVTYD